jgi:hypothetical protein
VWHVPLREVPIETRCTFKHFIKKEQGKENCG